MYSANIGVQNQEMFQVSGFLAFERHGGEAWREGGPASVLSSFVEQPKQAGNEQDEQGKIAPRLLLPLTLQQFSEKRHKSMSTKWNRANKENNFSR